MMGKLVAVLIVCTLSMSVSGQQSLPVSKHAAKVKQQVQAFDVGQRVVIVQKGKPDLLGILTSENDFSLELEDPDTHITVSVLYDDIKKVKQYQRHYSNSHSGVGRTVAEVGGGIVIIGLIIFVVVALHSGA